MQKLDFYGDEYIYQRIELETRKKRENDEFKHYLTKAVELIVQNTANNAIGERSGYIMTASFGEKPKEQEREPDVEEIKKKQRQVWQRLKGARQ